MTNLIWSALVVVVSVLIVLYFGSRIARLVSTSSAPQIIALLIAVDIVSAAILTVAFAEYWWLPAIAGLAAAIGLGIVMAKTVAIYRSQPQVRVDRTMFSFHWRRLLWASVGLSLITAVMAVLLHSLVPLLLLALPAISVLLGLAALAVVEPNRG